MTEQIENALLLEIFGDNSGLYVYEGDINEDDLAVGDLLEASWGEKGFYKIQEIRSNGPDYKSPFSDKKYVQPTYLKVRRIPFNAILLKIDGDPQTYRLSHPREHYEVGQNVEGYVVKKIEFIWGNYQVGPTTYYCPTVLSC